KTGATVQVVRPEPIGGTGMADELFGPVLGVVSCESPPDTRNYVEDDAGPGLPLGGIFRPFRGPDPGTAGSPEEPTAPPPPPPTAPGGGGGRSRDVRRLFEFSVEDEVPAWWSYGPHGRMVAGLIQQVTRLREPELVRFGEASHRARTTGGEGLRNGYIRALA